MPKVCLSWRVLTWFLLFGATNSMAGCRGSAELSDADVQAIRATLEDYRQAWLNNDAERVMSHVSDSIIMFVPGATGRTIVGKTALRAFWFPPQDTTYPIRKYEISEEQIHGSGNFAIAQGRSLLSWEMVARDSVLSAATSKSEFLTTLRKEGGQWKLFRQMYVTRS
jgi:ketosteroid isomerase-like protein